MGGSKKVLKKLNIHVKMGKTQLCGLHQKCTEETELFKSWSYNLVESGEWSRSEPFV